jgi:hypothetical protein
MLAIIDSDSIVYASAGAAQHRNEDGILEYEPVAYALSNAKQLMFKILERTGCNDYRAFLTESNDTTAYRAKLFPDYKANRKNTPRPRYYKEVREYLINQWDAEVVGTIEADDAVCMIQQELYKGYFSEQIGLGYEEGFNFVIPKVPAVLCGIDKDLNQMPGLHYNYQKDEFYYVTPLEGLRSLYLQMLTGDKADNIPRIKKGWKQKQAAEMVSLAEDEFTLYAIVFDEIYKVKYNKKSETNITDEQEKEINKEIQWRGDLLYLKRFPEDSYKLPVEEVSHE